MSLELEEIKGELADSISQAFDAPVDDILTLHPSGSDGVSGYLLSGGGLYQFEAEGRQIELNYLPNETRELNDYVTGFLAGSGIHTDSDQPYDWALGFYRVDAPFKCKPGNVPCGNRCLPKGQKCRKGVGASVQGAIKNAGNFAKNNAGALAAGVGVAGLAAGVAASGAIAQGARSAGVAAQRAAGKDVRKGAKAALAAAKEKVQEGQEQTERAARTADVMARRAAGRGARKAAKQASESVNQTGADLKQKVQEGQTQAEKAAKEGQSQFQKAARTADVAARRAAGKDVRKSVKETTEKVQKAASDVANNVRKAAGAAVVGAKRTARNIKNVAESLNPPKPKKSNS